MSARTPGLRLSRTVLRPLVVGAVAAAGAFGSAGAAQAMTSHVHPAQPSAVHGAPAGANQRSAPAGTQTSAR